MGTNVEKSGETHRFLELDGFIIRLEGKELLSLEFQPPRGDGLGVFEPIDNGLLFFRAQLRTKLEFRDFMTTKVYARYNQVLMPILRLEAPE